MHQPQQVVMDPVSGMSKGFGFVRFSSEEEKDSVRGSIHPDRHT
jgi:hypothetical protein